MGGEDALQKHLNTGIENNGKNIYNNNIILRILFKNTKLKN